MKEYLKKILEERIKIYGFNIGNIYKSLDSNLRELIKDETYYLGNVTFQERFYNLLNPNPDKKCGRGNTRTFKDLKTGYSGFCKSNCECNKEESRIKRSGKLSEEEKNLRKEKTLQTKEEKKKWVPDNFENYTLDDLKEYLKDGLDKYSNNLSTMIKVMPYFINDKIMECTKDMPEKTKVMERIYNIMNPDVDNTCKCGNKTKFTTYTSGYSKFCGPNSVCEANKEDQRKKVKEYQNKLSEEERKLQDDKSKNTAMENWGYESHMQSPEFKEKYQNEIMEKYGVKSNIERDEVQEKIKNTCLERHGVEKPFQNKEIHKKAMEGSKESNGGECCKKAREEYKNQTGLDSCFQDPNWQQKTRDERLERTGSTSPIGSKEVQEKMKLKEQEKTGRDHHTQRMMSDDAFETLNDPEKLRSRILSSGSVEMLAMELNIHNSIIYKRIKEFSLSDVNIKTKSSVEDSIEEFLKSIGVKYKKNCRKTLKNKKELDFLLEDHNLAIEYDSFYYHNIDHPNLKGNTKYHKDKTDECEGLGIQLIHIFQDEWLSKMDIVKSKIKNLVGLSEKGIGGRKAILKEITYTESSEFLESRHLQGKTTGVSINIGAYHEDDLISVMSFGKKSNNTYDLKRFATDGKNHPGLASRMLTKFINDHNPKEIISFADRRWSYGNVYKKLGFVDVGTIPEDYSYIKDNFYRTHKFNFRRDKLIDLLSVNDIGQTEKELAKQYGLQRIYDCGKIKYLLDEKTINDLYKKTGK